MGRSIQGPKLVENIDGSSEAKKRVRVVLETIGGLKSVADACSELGIAEARFHELRREILAGALERAEPRSPGRPAQTPSEADTRVAELEAQLDELRVELQAARIREEIAVTMPHLLRPREGAGKKTKRPASSSRSSSQELFGRRPDTTP